MPTLYASECKWALCERKRDFEKLGDHIHAKHVVKILKSEKGFTCMWRGCNKTFTYRSLLTCHINLAHIQPLQNTSKSENSSFESENDLSSESETSSEIKKKKPSNTKNGRVLDTTNWTTESVFDMGQETRCKNWDKWPPPEKLYDRNSHYQDHSNGVPKVKCQNCSNVFSWSTILGHLRVCKSTPRETYLCPTSDTKKPSSDLVNKEYEVPIEHKDSKNNLTLNTNNSKASTVGVNWTSESIFEMGQKIKCKHCDQWLLAEKLYRHNEKCKDHSNVCPRVKCRLCSNVLASSSFTGHYRLCELKSRETHSESNSQDLTAVDSKHQTQNSRNNNNKDGNLPKGPTMTSTQSSEPTVLEYGCEVACHVCQKSFASQWMYKHMRLFHNRLYSERVKCPKCAKILTASSFHRHYLKCKTK